jgi:hypothetical protein
MNDLRIALSQIESFNILKNFADLHHCLVNLVLLGLGKYGMCTKLGGIRKVSPFNVSELNIH